MAFFNVTPQQQYEALYPTLSQAPDTSVMEAEKKPGVFEGMGTGAWSGLKSAYYRDLFNVATATGETDLQQKAMDNLKALKPDPNTIGVAGQLLFGFGDQLGTIYAAASGGNVTPQLMAMEGGKSYARSQTELNVAAGMDRQTASDVASIEGAGLGLGVVLPAAVPGKLMMRAATGAGIMGGFGVGQRYMISDVLKSRGYDEMAQQYAPLDGTAIATDLALGAFFGGLMGPRATAVPKPKPSVIDAALTAAQQRHMEIDTAPGIPADARARSAHIAAMEEAEMALMRGERPVVEPLLRDTAFINKPMPEGIDVEAIVRAELERAGAHDVIADLRRIEAEAQARGLAVEGDALPEVARVVEARTPASLEELVAAIREKYGVELNVEKRDGSAYIGSVVVPKEKRGAGVGTAAMKEFLRGTDELGVRTELVPDPIGAVADRGKAQAGLERFYKRLGFEITRDETDPEFGRFVSMSRSPRAPTDAKLSPPEVEKPSMQIPDSSGRMITASEAVAAAAEDAKIAGELAQGFEVAADCALRFGA